MGWSVEYRPVVDAQIFAKNRFSASTLAAKKETEEGGISSPPSFPLKERNRFPPDRCFSCSSGELSCAEVEHPSAWESGTD